MRSCDSSWRCQQGVTPVIVVVVAQGVLDRSERHSVRPMDPDKKGRPWRIFQTPRAPLGVRCCAERMGAMTEQNAPRPGYVLLRCANFRIFFLFCTASPLRASFAAISAMEAPAATSCFNVRSSTDVHGRGGNM